ncbi:hypothetical protein TSUD_96920 [Trifolium subterraneum]|nr:hypothetical protein TSUD_96920 [Trifolium subterraneum]
MESPLRTEGMLDILHEALKVLRDWRRELKELRLSIPIIEGRDVDGWMIKVEKYFDARGVSKEEDQIPAVAQWMSGGAITWYQLWVLANPIATWGNFTEAILKQFGPETDSHKEENPIEKGGRKFVGEGEGSVVEKRKATSCMLAVFLSTKPPDKGIVGGADPRSSAVSFL